MAHLFHLTVDISYGTTADVVSYLISQGLITNNGQLGYKHKSGTVTVEVTVPNKNKFLRWLKRREKNRDRNDPRYLVKTFKYKGPEPGVLGKGEILLRKTRKRNYERGQKM